MSKLKNEIKDFKLDLTSTICLIMKLEIESHYSKNRFYEYFTNQIVMLSYFVTMYF